RELLARVKRALRTHAVAATAEDASRDIGADARVRPPLLLGDVMIDTAAGKAYVGDTLLDLTALEYRLLLLFATHKGQVLSRTQILEGIWDGAGSFVEDNTLTVYIKRLREKLGDAARIETVRGMGYRAD
ncbi:MAG TPA: DNA-binding response regulator, partial [Coriobacteriia bacterium]|nr:DNA-binding response regulator [Coriobacteriia bacterium]